MPICPDNASTMQPRRAASAFSPSALTSPPRRTRFGWPQGAISNTRSISRIGRALSVLACLTLLPCVAGAQDMPGNLMRTSDDSTARSLAIKKRWSALAAYPAPFIPSFIFGRLYSGNRSGRDNPHGRPRGDVPVLKRSSCDQPVVAEIAE